jgi:DNA-binding response OmpR family regulator/class 3 adenylate cyclase/predicted ATPase
MVVGRDVTLRAHLARLLNGAGYRVEIADSALRAGRLGFKGIALAIVAPDGLGQEGKSLLQQLRAAVGSVLLVAAPGGERELHSDVLDVSDEAGLLARVAEALEPAPAADPDAVEPVLQFAGYRLDLSGHSLLDQTGKGVPLTRSEFSLLRVFVRRPGRVLSRDQLLQMFAGHDAEAYDRSVDMQIVRLRRKIEPDPRRPSLIVTIPGSGYRFSAKVTAGAIEAPGEARSEVATTMPPPSPPAMSERLQLTIMQCALSGSAFMSAQGDPEDLHRLLTTFHESCARIVAQAGGTVARLLNDGVLAYFGYPQADEHQAERAIRAALELVQASGPIDMREPDGMWTRVSIATGLVVVGGLLGASGEPAALGEPAILATGLLAQAAPGAVLISATTRRLVGELFQCKEREPIALAGFAEPVTVWQVTGQDATEDRFEALHGPHAADLVGRDEELALLLRRWEEAKSGDGCVVLISGEPGIGKSRIVKAMRDRIGVEAYAHARYFCSPHHRDSALHPIIAQLQRSIGFRREDTAEQRLIKLEAALAQATKNVGEAAPLLADLLSIPTGDRYPPLSLTPQKRKEQTLAALLTQVEGLAARRPALLIFEDAHWVDPTTREALDLIVDRAPRLSVLLIITFRPEFAPPWIGRSHVTLLAINRLRPRERSQMITRVTGGKALPGEIVDRILDRSDGVPLFIEELTKAILESGTLTEGDDRYTIAETVGLPAIPTTLHASLLVRLDRSAPAREVAQIGAALGRQFSHELISAVAQMPPQAVDGALATLAGAELIFRRGTPPDAEYTFKHALVQDAAYDTLLKSRRQELHGRIARVLEAQFAEETEQQPELLAHHFTQAGLIERAVIHWGAAGRKSAARSAMTEAVAQLRKALELLATLPDSLEHQHQELDLQSALGAALVASKGIASAETGDAYARARALCEQLGDAAALIPVLSGQISFHNGRGEYVIARQIAEDLLRLTQSHGNSASQMVGSRAMGLCLHILGDFSGAIQHFERVLSLYDPEAHRAIATVAAYDMRAMALANLSWDLFLLGYPQQALLRCEEALSWSKKTNHPHTLLYALIVAAFVHVFRRDDQAAEVALTEVFSLAVPGNLRVWLSPANILYGRALVARGEIAEGLKLAREGMAEKKAQGTVLNQTFFFAHLAQCCGRSGQADEAWDLLVEALEMANRTGERWFEAELHRLQGDWLRV